MFFFLLLFVLFVIVVWFVVGRLVCVVWVNELGGVIFWVDFGMGVGCEFIKVVRRGIVDFVNEVWWLCWVVLYLVVLWVLGVGVDGDWVWLYIDVLFGLFVVYLCWWVFL